MSGALIRLRGAKRRYMSGDREVFALRGVDLDIFAGEMVALMGASGSGKSTLMNILGCLDRPSEGSYHFLGKDAAALDRDSLAALRRAHFGFVFQRYNLLPQLSALANVEVPAIYAGLDPRERRARASALLVRLGLSERLSHRPGELSGGQQQRVSIARALMNGGEIILADEPTGALDSSSGREVMELLLELNRAGHTLIVATHDPTIASFAHRIIRLADGAIVSDGPAPSPPLEDVERSCDSGPRAGLLAEPRSAEKIVVDAAARPRFVEAFAMAAVALFSHRLRTALTLLGIVIGIVAVITMVALGEAADRILADELKGLATNTLEIYPGRDWGDPNASTTQTLSSLDVDALRRQSYVEDATPVLSQTALVRYRAASGRATVSGVGVDMFHISGHSIVKGVGFSHDDVERQALVVVIDQNMRRRFFGDASPIGATVYIAEAPCVVIGVTGRNYQQEARGGSQLNAWIPHTTASARLLGRSHLDSIIVSLRDGAAPLEAERRLTSLLSMRHRAKDFMVFNLAERVRAGVATSETMSLLLTAIGVLSLTVAGIGVMNIMLVSVAERAKEIGVRVAVGARQADIRNQFLIEAASVCLIGSALGVLASFFVCRFAASVLPAKWDIWLSPSAALVALVGASVTALIFGYAPARNAAQLDPVESLARD